MSSMAYGTEETLLAIVVDLLPTTVASLLDQLKIFMEAHVLLRPFNKILLITTCGEESRFLYPSSGDKYKRTYGKGDMLEAINNLRGHLLRTNCKKNGSMGAALTLGICFVNRWLNKKSEDESVHGAAQDGRLARILILTETMKGNHVELDPKAKDYRAVMNCAFSAEKMNVLIDCFDVTPWSPALSSSQMSKMQQVCYISRACTGRER